MSETEALEQVAAQFTVGQYVTVSRWVGSGDRSFVGEVFHVKKVEAPFLVVEALERSPLFNPRRVFDLRAVDLQPLSEEFVQSLRGMEH